MKKKQEDLRTKKRSDIRLMLGGWYYTWRRYIYWMVYIKTAVCQRTWK